MLIRILVLQGIMMLFAGCVCNLYALDCASAIAMDCGMEMTGNTDDGQSTCNTYCFMDTDIWKGKEVIFKVELTSKSDLFLTVVSYRGPLPYIFMAADCVNEPCIDYGNDVVGSTDLDPGTYYFILDGRDSGIEYHIRIDCKRPVPSFTLLGELFCCIGFLVFFHYSIVQGKIASLVS